MPLPTAREARPFYRTAYQRMENAGLLMRFERSTGAVYLAGYAIECALKALLLTLAPRARRMAILASFRGTRGHDFDWLRFQLRLHGGVHFPRDIAGALVVANSWEPALGYAPHNLRAEDAAYFFRAAESIMNWADGRM